MKKLQATPLSRRQLRRRLRQDMDRRPIPGPGPGFLEAVACFIVLSTVAGMLALSIIGGF